MDTIKNIIPIFQEIFLDFSQVFSSYAHQISTTFKKQSPVHLKPLVKTVIPTKTYFYGNKHPWVALPKKYLKAYIQLLSEIYQESQEAVETDRIPLYLIVTIPLILILGTALFLFALLG